MFISLHKNRAFSQITKQLYYQFVFLWVLFLI